MPAGGKREGAGRPRKPVGERRAMASYKLPPVTLDTIRRLAEERGTSQAEVIRLAVEALDQINGAAE